LISRFEIIRAMNLLSPQPKQGDVVLYTRSYQPRPGYTRTVTCSGLVILILGDQVAIKYYTQTRYIPLSAVTKIINHN
jgi:hypothetical protein